jgi:hypothetical protein
MDFYCPHCQEFRGIDESEYIAIEPNMVIECPCCLNKYRVDLVLVEEDRGNG